MKGHGGRKFDIIDSFGEGLEESNWIFWRGMEE